MASLNKVMIIGNIGKDPEIRMTTGGTPVASFPVATSERFKNQQGEWEERTEWHNVKLWGKLAEIARDHLAKGKSVYIEGRLQTRKWQDRDGHDRWTTEIIGDRMQMLGGRTSEVSGGRPATKPGMEASEGNSYTTTYDEPVITSDDDIPF